MHSALLYLLLGAACADPVPPQCIKEPCDSFRGTYKLSDGSTYSGELDGGEPHGYGDLVYPDGNYYEGEFRHGERSGYGFATLDNDSYRGEWEDDRMTGFGTYDFKSEDGVTEFYTGEWRAGKAEGRYFEVKSPSTSNASDISGNHIASAVDTQADDIILNLSDSDVDLMELKRIIISERPLQYSTLNEVWIIRGGKMEPFLNFAQ